MNVPELLKTAIDLERRGRTCYLEAAERVHNSVVKAVCMSLARDEEMHEETINQFYEALQRTEGWVDPPDDLCPPLPARERLDRIIADAAAAIGPDASYIEVYRAAYDLETQSYDFYSSAADEARRPALIKFLRFLANVEKTHMEVLDMLLDSTRQIEERT